MRWRPRPLSVTSPPPSRTTRALVFLTLAVAFIRIVTGFGPHAKRMIPPARTAAITAADVQLGRRAVADDMVRMRGVHRSAGRGDLHRSHSRRGTR